MTKDEGRNDERRNDVTVLEVLPKRWLPDNSTLKGLHSKAQGCRASGYPGKNHERLPSTLKGLHGT
jgi:hypothetical protein